MGLPPGVLQIQTNHSQMTPQPPQPPGSTTNNGPPMLASMQTIADPQLSGPNVATNSQQSTSPTFYGDQSNASAPPQQINSPTDPQLSNSIVSSPISPHLQQNGYGNGAPNASTITGNGQLPYAQQQQPPAPSHNGAQGTWSGPNTLTYTQTMLPPDPRSSHNNYCKRTIFCHWLLLSYSSFEFCFGFQGMAALR